MSTSHEDESAAMSEPEKSPKAPTQAGPDECIICHDTITVSCHIQPCAHRHFDFLCVATWLFENPACPICRTPAQRLVRDATGESISNFRSSDPTLQIRSSSPSSSTRPSRRQQLPRQSWPASVRRPRPRHRNLSRESAHGFSSASNSGSSNTSDSAIRQREEVYLHNRYSMHVGTNRASHYREITPQSFQDEQLVSRARMFMRRELRVFSFLRPESNAGPDDAAGHRRLQNAEFLLEYIIAILKTVDMMGSAGQAEDMLSDFLGRDNTKLFLHELRAWLRSPYTRLEDWDRAVQYEGDPRLKAQRSSRDDRRRIMSDCMDHHERAMSEGDRERARDRVSRDAPGRKRLPRARTVDTYRPSKRRFVRQEDDDGRRRDHDSNEPSRTRQ